jgi:primosomal protein N' (replication factor Y)
MLYADVCVNTPVGAAAPGPVVTEESERQAFTYAVPAALSGRLAPGHLVWIPFRSRRVQGIVLRVHDAAPDFQTRELMALVWAQPVLTPSQLELATWISEQTLAPLIESLRLMLPAGLSQRGRTVFARTSTPAPGGLTEKQVAVLARIAEKPGDWSEISADLSASGVKRLTQRDDLEPLIEMHLVSREAEFPSPPPRPKTDRLVRLLVGPVEVAAALPTLGRASKQASALSWLASRVAVPLRELLTGVPCERGTVKALADRGWLTIIAGEQRGEPATVRLALARDAVPNAIEELRGTAKHRAVLELLLAQGEPTWIGRIYAETDATLDTLRELEAAGLISVAEEMVWRDPLAGRDFALDTPPALTADQEGVWQAIQAGRGAFLLHGVTGSGKTEIYLRAIEAALSQGRQAVVLVPEIALTPQTIRRFAARFPGKVTVWHSELGEGERFDVWRRVRTAHGAAQVVVGSRSALFLPYGDLGVVVVDEEHEPSYKQERTPRYHARAVALELGRLCDATVILGSATPSLETYYAARRGDDMKLLSLPERIKADLPVVHVADMRQELRMGNRSMFSRRLSEGLRQVLDAGQQAILYLNRRGSATCVLCRDCGYVAVCQKCYAPLTYHGDPSRGSPASPSSPSQSLVCHQCNRRYPIPTLCPKCGSVRIRYFGAGTERVEEAVKLEFPKARTLRWDRDVTGAKGSHDAILAKFISHEADILIGTQMIAKGLDLPLVTLVGVVAADTSLFLPDFRASERTFQLLTQVAGRAGRSALGGEVIVQTYHPDHYAILAASNHDYEGFYREEMGFRRQQMYPPLRRLARLVFYHGQRDKAQAEAEVAAGLLRAEIGARGLANADVIGPAPCFFARQRGEWRWQVVLRAPDPVSILRGITVNRGWRVDVDPVDLL